MHPARYQEHLDRVSRSFAFCIAQLPDPLRQWTALSYLLCRVLDTIEDAPWPQAKARRQNFFALDRFIGQPPSRGELVAWTARFPSGLPAGEQLLLQDAEPLFADLAALPAAVAGPIRQTVLQMSAGMRHFSDRQGEGGTLRLADLGDLNRYCFFVAGTVGHLLSQLFCCFLPAFVPPPGWTKNALHFGLFLQKVNILKDQRDDERHGRFLVPERALVWRSLAGNADGAMAYLAALPAEQRGFRTFCAWSLFLGAASLPHLEASWRGEGGKISRAETTALLAEVSEMVGDNPALAARLAGMLADCSPAGRAPPPAPASLEVPWFVRRAKAFLRPPMAAHDLGELGMV